LNDEMVVSGKTLFDVADGPYLLESAEFSAALLGRCLPPMLLDPHLGELIQLV